MHSLHDQLGGSGAASQLLSSCRCAPTINQPTNAPAAAAPAQWRGKHAYFRNGFDQLDALVVATSLVEVVGSGPYFGVAGLRMLSALRPLLIVRRSKILRVRNPPAATAKQQQHVAR